jgi:hypothetical protein
MINKKFISVVCAAALSATSFASLTAFADGETVLYSDTYDSQTTGIFCDGTTTNANTSTQLSGLTCVTTNRGAGDAGIYVDSEGTTVNTGSYYSIEEKTDTDKYFHLSYPMFGDYGKNGRWAHVDFAEAYTADATKDIVMDFDLKLNDGMIKGVTDESNADNTNPVLRIGTFDSSAKTSTAVAIDKDAASIGDDWTHARIITTASGSKLYIAGEEITSAANDNVTSLAQIGLYFSEDSTVGNMTPPLDAKDTWLDADTPTLTPSADLDNVVIYSVAAGTATATSQAPTAEESEPEPTAEPTATPAPAAEITETTTYDFETDDTTVTPSVHKDYTTATVVDGSDDANQTKVMQIAQTSAKDNSYGYATFDFSELTSGATHVIFEYDLYVGSDGRLKVILQDGAPEGSKATELASGLIPQGITGGSSKPNIVENAWVHTVVDVDLNSGTGTYTVTSLADNSVVGTKAITTDLKSVTTLSLVSWSANTSYIDNITVKTDGITVATPEPASSVEGSEIDLVPSEARETIGDLSAAEGTSSKVLNHSTAKAAVTTGKTDIAAYSDKARGNSVYVAYDVNLDVNSSIEVVPYGNSGDSQASTLQLSTNSLGIATVSAITGSSSSQTASETLVAGTWYRVVIEIPQAGTSEATTTGEITYTIYRINPEDPTQVSGVAAQLKGLSARGIAERGVSSIGVTVSGTVYIDNGVVYLSGTSSEEAAPLSVVYTVDEAGKVTLATNNVAGSAVVIFASYDENKRLTAAVPKTVSFTAAEATYEVSGNAGDKVVVLVKNESGAFTDIALVGTSPE